MSDGLPPGGAIRSLAHLDGRLYALVAGGGKVALYALDRGATAWTPEPFTPRSGAEQPHSLARMDTALYITTTDAAAGKGGLYRREYDASSWTSLNALPDRPASALVKRNAELLVALSGPTADAGLWASSDQGLTWRKRTGAVGESAFFREPVQALVAAAAAQRFFAVGSAAAGFGGLYQSDDGGATWEKGPVRGDVRALGARGAIALVTTTLEGTRRSDNYGNTWHACSLGADARAFALTDARAFAGTGRGVRASVDLGLSWSEPTEAQGDVSLLYLAGTSLLGASGGRVFEAYLAPDEKP